MLFQTSPPIAKKIILAAINTRYVGWWTRGYSVKCICIKNQYSSEFEKYN